MHSSSNAFSSRSSCSSSRAASASWAQVREEGARGSSLGRERTAAAAASASSSYNVDVSSDTVASRSETARRAASHGGSASSRDSRRGAKRAHFRTQSRSAPLATQPLAPATRPPPPPQLRRARAECARTRRCPALCDAATAATARAKVLGQRPGRTATQRHSGGQRATEVSAAALGQLVNCVHFTRLRGACCAAA